MSFANGTHALPLDVRKAREDERTRRYGLARNRALRRLADDQPSLYRRYYTEELHLIQDNAPPLPGDPT